LAKTLVVKAAAPAPAEQTLIVSPAQGPLESTHIAEESYVSTPKDRRKKNLKIF